MKTQKNRSNRSRPKQLVTPNPTEVSLSVNILMQIRAFVKHTKFEGGFFNMITKESICKNLKALELNDRYDLVHSEFNVFWELTQESLWDGLYAMFKYGYLKGQRALKAEMKRKAVKA